jgi:F0F1-type ATP synthase epsilon subunit
VNEISSAIAAVLGGGVGIWAIRVFRTAMSAQAEINAEKNRTIERLEARAERAEERAVKAEQRAERAEADLRAMRLPNQ